MAQDSNRFEKIHSESARTEGSEVLRDRETGVCYLYHWWGQTGGLTVLLNSDGSPVTRPATER